MPKFYWQQIDNDDIGNPVFAITPKEHFDAEGCLLDDEFDETDLADGFHYLTDSQFEFDGTVDEGLNLLRNNALFEAKTICSEDED